MRNVCYHIFIHISGKRLETDEERKIRKEKEKNRDSKKDGKRSETEEERRIRKEKEKGKDRDKSEKEG